MRKTTFLFLLTLLTSSLGGVNAQNATVPNKKLVVEEIVAVVGNETISLSELYEATQMIIENRKQYGINTKLQPAEEALELMLRQKLLTARARLDSLDQNLRPLEEDIQNRLDQMIKEAGSLTALEKSSGKTISQMREDMKKIVTDGEMSRMMDQKVRDKVTITHSEVIEFLGTLNLDSIAPMGPQVSYAQIVKVPPATTERKFEARQKLLDLRDRILKGEKLSVLARLYSQDYSTRNSGGEMTLPFVQMAAPFADALRLLKPGQISEIVETEYGFHIIELISKDETMFTARHILMKPEFTAEEETKAYSDLDSIASVIREGKMNFAEAARLFSDDVHTKMNGGQNMNLQEFNVTGNIRRASTKFFLDQLDAIDNNTITKLKKGEISIPYQNLDKLGNLVYKIVIVTDLIPAHQVNINDDFDFIADYALGMKKEKVVSEWINDAINKIYIRINPEYLNYNFTNEGWKKQSEKYAGK